MSTQGAQPPPAPADDGKMVDLSDAIDKSKCFVRNEDAKCPMTNLFIGDSRLGCKSDVDEQLIIHLAFRDFVRVSCMLSGWFPNTVTKSAHRSNLHFALHAL